MTTLFKSSTPLLLILARRFRKMHWKSSLMTISPLSCDKHQTFFGHFFERSTKMSETPTRRTAAEAKLLLGAIRRAAVGSYRSGDQRLLLAEIDRLRADLSEAETSLTEMAPLRAAVSSPEREAVIEAAKRWASMKPFVVRPGSANDVLLRAVAALAAVGVSDDRNT
jgi:hypothetical protein